ncbi:uncharacterized protein LOC113495362 [Trichoplusia ni]|uniref:Uncharacterized protein LOC113495362 n=1 Tax=Trichoplusia ni TaxID=7111 RepID=A0A7E5VNK0_TRINI|nr:uncharacterized protein LOC113495362 [Trichoplusia ni]
MAAKSKGPPAKAKDPLPDGDIDLKMFDPESKDPLTSQRGICLEKDCSVRVFFLALRECTQRVTAKKKFTKETCEPEVIELMEALDKCVADKAFVKLS